MNPSRPADFAGCCPSADATASLDFSSEELYEFAVHGAGARVPEIRAALAASPAFRQQLRDFKRELFENPHAFETRSAIAPTAKAEPPRGWKRLRVISLHDNRGFAEVIVPRGRFEPASYQPAKASERPTAGNNAPPPGTGTSRPKLAPS